MKLISFPAPALRGRGLGQRPPACEAPRLAVSHNATRMRIQRGMQTHRRSNLRILAVAHRVAVDPHTGDRHPPRPRQAAATRTRVYGHLQRLLLLAAASTLAACGSTAVAAPPTVRTSSHPSPTPEARDKEVLSAYLAATAAFVHAETTMDPDDPALPATMTGDELSTVKKNLIIDRAGGLIARGSITPGSPHVVSVNGAVATLRDCAYSGLVLYDSHTGRTAPGNLNGPQSVGVTATFTNVGGVWKEASVDGRFGSCPLGY